MSRSDPLQINDAYECTAKSWVMVAVAVAVAFRQQASMHSSYRGVSLLHRSN
ncbi:hypothetical protein EV13_1487 [Prochlorococcus sp. MIT 0702]|nr:hypothetical protein EV12_0677 [Prochlorococcus sp. MIT 0701]KGG28743.1 hypothetical protein EV13_1487 [Prochlorococcus sp. MIT 0702]KGG35922.1 hypothetical protein EV14_0716 [Prochlorococcus sp. MIT 0703]